MVESEWLLLGAGALGGVLIATVIASWRAGRVIAELRTRLHLSELARHAVQERSDQARLQIGQLTKALADANRLLARNASATAPAPAPVPPPAVPLAQDEEVLLTRRGPPQVFPDTQVL
jgi:hypothetical protein